MATPARVKGCRRDMCMCLMSLHMRGVSCTARGSPLIRRIAWACAGHGAFPVPPIQGPDTPAPDPWPRDQAGREAPRHHSNTHGPSHCRQYGPFASLQELSAAMAAFEPAPAVFFRPATGDDWEQICRIEVRAAAGHSRSARPPWLLDLACTPPPMPREQLWVFVALQLVGQALTSRPCGAHRRRDTQRMRRPAPRR